MDTKAIVSATNFAVGTACGIGTEMIAELAIDKLLEDRDLDKFSQVMVSVGTVGLSAWVGYNVSTHISDTMEALEDCATTVRAKWRKFLADTRPNYDEILRKKGLK